MILADKILSLRKRNGWSQDELAEQLNVSRQSVSKWESAQSIPDIGKLIDMARLFGVTTDYLLKDELVETQFTDSDGTAGVARVTLDEANAYIRDKCASGKRLALGVMLCILSPILLILLAGWADGGHIDMDAANAIGLTAMFVLVAAGVAFILSSGMHMRRYAYLEKSSFDTEYGVLGIVDQKRADYEGAYSRNIVLGVTMCILSAVPLILAGLVEAGDMVYLLLTALLIACVAAAVYLFIATCTRKDSYDVLLKEGDYTPAAVERNQKGEWIGGVYWPVTVAVYLAVSILTMRWDISWVVWPVAALVYAGICAAIRRGA